MRKKLLPTEREALLREYAARKGLFSAAVDPHADVRAAQQDEFLNELHPKQRAFVESPAKRKIARCGRRAGKTAALLYIFMQYGRRFPNATLPYVTLTRDQARRNFWRPLKQLNQRFRLGMDFNEQRLVAKFPNGAEITLVGAQDSDAIEKLRGDKFPLVAIDEIGSFKPHVEELVLDVLDAALGDYDGTMLLTGTPPRVPAGFFFDAASSGDWECHHWNILDNSKFPQWAGKPDWEDHAKAYLERKAKQLGEHSPVFIREQLGEFYQDQDAQYFKFKPGRNTFAVLERRNWLCGLGIDFGYEDPTAFVVLAASPFDDNLYVVETFAKSKMTDLEIVAKVVELEQRYNIVKRVVDFAAKQYVVSLNQRYSLNLVAANKGDRLQQIDLLNSDFLTGKLKIADTEQEFQKELLSVVWDEDHTGPAPTRQMGHHADRHDALRYIWSAMQAYRGKLIGDPEGAKELEQVLESKIDPWEQEAQDRMARQREDYRYEG